MLGGVPRHGVGAPRDLDLAALYLPALDGAQRPAVVSSFGRMALFIWPIRERCRCRAPVETLSLSTLETPEAARQAFARWLATSGADRVVVLEEVPAAAFGAAPRAVLPVLAEAMAEQRRFVRIASRRTPDGDAAVSVWRRAGE